MLWLVLSGVVSMSAAQAPAKAANISGTRWQFPPSLGPDGTIVTFRKDGVVMFSDTKSTGHWEQTGDSVVFDCNDFTEYHVRIVGNEMTGEWVRLRGEQKSETFPTSLKKR